MSIRLVIAMAQAVIYGPVAPADDPARGDAIDSPCPDAIGSEIVVCKRNPAGVDYRYHELSHAYDPPDGMPLVRVKLPGGLCIVGLSIGTCRR